MGQSRIPTSRIYHASMHSATCDVQYLVPGPRSVILTTGAILGRETAGGRSAWRTFRSPPAAKSRPRRRGHQAGYPAFAQGFRRQDGSAHTCRLIRKPRLAGNPFTGSAAPVGGKERIRPPRRRHPCPLLPSLSSLASNPPAVETSGPAKVNPTMLSRRKNCTNGGEGGIRTPGTR